MNDKLLVGELAETRIALPAGEIRSVIEIDALVPVPHAPAHIAGMTAVRSQALTVIDSRASLGLPPRPFHTGGCAAVVERQGHSYALLLDRVDDVCTARSEPVAVAGEQQTRWRGAAVGMVELDGGPAMLLDPGAIALGSARDTA